MRTYTGVIAEPMDWRVYVDEEGKSRRPLDKHLTVRNHSPDGFAWGYGGSGPAQLALALLIDAAGVERATRAYQRFKEQALAPMPQSMGWTMTSKVILAWLDDDEAKHPRESWED